MAVALLGAQQEAQLSEKCRQPRGSTEDRDKWKRTWFQKNFLEMGQEGALWPKQNIQSHNERMPKAAAMEPRPVRTHLYIMEAFGYISQGSKS